MLRNDVKSSLPHRQNATFRVILILAQGKLDNCCKMRCGFLSEKSVFSHDSTDADVDRAHLNKLKPSGTKRGCPLKRLADPNPPRNRVSFVAMREVPPV